MSITNKKNIKEKMLFWDNYKGLLIFLVVFGHFTWEYYSCSSYVAYITKAIYLFHMPMFIFISGYLSKSENSKSLKSVNKLLLFYVIFNTLMMLYLFIFENGNVNFVNSYNSYWYLIAIVLMRITVEKIKNIKYILPISIIISLLAGYYSWGITGIQKTLALYPMFLLGYNFDAKKLKKIVSNVSLKKIIIGIISLVIFLLMLFWLVKYGNYSTNMLVFGKYQNSFDFIQRIGILLISVVGIISAMHLIPNKKLPLITKWGQNSLYVYVTHRVITLIVEDILLKNNYTRIYFIYFFIITIVILIIFSSNIIKNIIDNFINRIDFIYNKNPKFLIKNVLVVFMMLLLLVPVKNFYHYSKKNYFLNNEVNKLEEYNPEVLENNLIRISYVGDLILLKDQVKYSKNNGKYNFDYMFKYAKKYLESADYAIGVYEGPSAGGNKYSTSNYGDGIKLYLNYPDEFATAVKNSGIDLVTTANNHMLDFGYDGAIRTLDVLEKEGIEYVGTYKNEKEKNEIKIIEVEGVKIAVLSYASGSNYYSSEYFFKTNPSFSKIIVKENNKYFEESKKMVINDLKKAKELNPDLILVMAHMGTQFKHSTNAMQNTWNKIFVENGADIVLGDHAHATEPIEYMGDSIIVNCPGNFANSYVKYDGDATSIVNIYIDKNTKDIKYSSIIPMMTQKISKGKYRAVPIYDIFTNDTLKSTLTNKELERSKEINKIVTKSMIGEEIPVEIISKEYFLYKEKPTISIDETDRNTELFKILNSSKSIAFLGDSVTEGTKNSYYPWYEPITNELNKNIKIYNNSKGSYTIKNLYNNRKNEISKINAEIFVIAIGANDIRYRNKSSAMTSKEYIEYMNKFIELIRKNNDNSKIIILEPWLSLDYDLNSKVELKEKQKLYSEYSDALKESYSKDESIILINQNNYISNHFKYNNASWYLNDFIHPNKKEGIILYSKAVLNSYIK